MSFPKLELKVSPEFEERLKEKVEKWNELSLILDKRMEDCKEGHLKPRYFKNECGHCYHQLKYSTKPYESTHYSRDPDEVINAALRMKKYQSDLAGEKLKDYFKARNNLEEKLKFNKIILNFFQFQ